MPRPKHRNQDQPDRPSDEAAGLAGTQTLVRGLDIIAAVESGAVGLDELSSVVGLSRSTTYRLASRLVSHRYLNFSRTVGYSLGSRLMELGYFSARQITLPQAAREHLELLADRSGDTVHLAVLDGRRALYLDKIPGSRRIEISSRIGERQPLRSTGIGKALILDDYETWPEYYDYEARQPYQVSRTVWLRRMAEYAKNGYAFDLEENEDRIRCVAAPIRDVAGKIVGAISVSSAAQYMDDMRMQGLAFEVKNTACAISRELGYSSPSRAVIHGSGAATQPDLTKPRVVASSRSGRKRRERATSGRK